MHIKRMHEMIEKLTECALCELCKGAECVNTSEFGEVIDMIKDLADAEYKARISKAMEKADEEEEAEDKHLLKMLKEEYGEEEGERRYYDEYRYKRSGRFAPKGKGSYMPRRGYNEQSYYHMTPEMMREHSPEYWRDVDRAEGRLYYSESMGNIGNRSDIVRTGSDRTSGMRDHREGRSGQSRRTYMETKEAHKSNTPEDKQQKMKELEKYMGELSTDISEMIGDASPEEKSLLKAKLQTLAQKV